MFRLPAPASSVSPRAPTYEATSSRSAVRQAASPRCLRLSLTPFASLAVFIVSHLLASVWCLAAFSHSLHLSSFGIIGLTAVGCMISDILAPYHNFYIDLDSQQRLALTFLLFIFSDFA